MSAINGTLGILSLNTVAKNHEMCFISKHNACVSAIPTLNTKNLLILYYLKPRQFKYMYMYMRYAVIPGTLMVRELDVVAVEIKVVS